MEYQIALTENPAPRCPVALLLDTSGSMDGQPISQLNKGVKTFFNEIAGDDFARFSVELEIITYGEVPERSVPFISFNKLTDVKYPNFTANGMTPMGGALSMAFKDLKERKNEYRRLGIPYYQPWIVLMTDGQPNDDWEEEARKVRKNAKEKKLVFLGVGVGDDVDMDTLKEICPANFPPKKLDGLKFSDFFEWLSQSLSGVSRSSVGDTVPLPPTDSWGAVSV